MSEHTPTTDEVRGYYAFGQIDDSDPNCPVRAEFDRWLAEVERAAAEKAWDEGANAVTCEWRLHPERGDAVVKHAQVRTRRPANPYGKGAWQ